MPDINFPSQSFEHERLITVGRLTSTLAHEVGNSMQIIRGALALALESQDEPGDLMDYVHLSYQETERVVKLIAFIREIYRPQTDEQVPLSAPELMERLVKLAKHEADKLACRLEVTLPPNLPLFQAVPNQLSLGFLCLILTLLDLSVKQGGKSLQIAAHTEEEQIFFTFRASLPLPAEQAAQDVAPIQDRLKAELVMAEDIARMHHGQLTTEVDASQLTAQVTLPIWKPQS